MVPPLLLTPCTLCSHGNFCWLQCHFVHRCPYVAKNKSWSSRPLGIPAHVTVYLSVRVHSPAFGFSTLVPCTWSLTVRPLGKDESTLGMLTTPRS